VSIAENIDIIRKRIAEASRSSGRKPEDILLIAVTKTRSPVEVDAAVAAGLGTIGENRVQEAREKFPLLASSPVKHMIGHLQSNKAKEAVKLFDLIQSVDSVRLLAVIDKEAKKNNKIMKVLAEVNIGGEGSKSGMNPGEIAAFLREAVKYENISVRGLMTIAPFLESAEQVRPYFKKMKELFDEAARFSAQNVKMEHLSMGMSGDFVTAIEEGATMVRIGTAIFGTAIFGTAIFGERAGG